MKIKILFSAMDDLTEGFEFYENQLGGLGNYFMETLFSDIDSLKLSRFTGFHIYILILLCSICRYA